MALGGVGGWRWPWVVWEEVVGGLLTSVVSTSVIRAVWWPPANMATSMHWATPTLGGRGAGTQG